MTRHEPLISVMLAVADAQAALAWYKRALGALPVEEDLEWLADSTR
jgi:catechol 2,3-dioxygenase-like lactoylglutathione lyase family enzyme